jgi:hypothetical protein
MNDLVGIAELAGILRRTGSPMDLSPIRVVDETGVEMVEPNPWPACREIAVRVPVQRVPGIWGDRLRRTPWTAMDVWCVLVMGVRDDEWMMYVGTPMDGITGTVANGEKMTREDALTVLMTALDEVLVGTALDGLAKVATAIGMKDRTLALEARVAASEAVGLTLIGERNAALAEVERLKQALASVRDQE